MRSNGRTGFAAGILAGGRLRRRSKQDGMKKINYIKLDKKFDELSPNLVGLAVLFILFSIVTFFVQIFLWLRHGYWQPASLNDVFMFFQNCSGEILNDNFSYCMNVWPLQFQTGWYGLNKVLSFIFNELHIFLFAIFSIWPLSSLYEWLSKIIKEKAEEQKI
jgi:hypothetical protein